MTLLQVEPRFFRLWRIRSTLTCLSSRAWKGWKKNQHRLIILVLTLRRPLVMPTLHTRCFLKTLRVFRPASQLHRDKMVHTRAALSTLLNSVTLPFLLIRMASCLWQDMASPLSDCAIARIMSVYLPKRQTCGLKIDYHLTGTLPLMTMDTDRKLHQNIIPLFIPLTTESRLTTAPAMKVRLTLPSIARNQLSKRITRLPLI